MTCISLLTGKLDHKNEFFCPCGKLNGEAPLTLVKEANRKSMCYTTVPNIYTLVDSELIRKLIEWSGNTCIKNFKIKRIKEAFGV